MMTTPTIDRTRTSVMIDGSERKTFALLKKAMNLYASVNLHPYWEAREMHTKPGNFATRWYEGDKEGALLWYEGWGTWHHGVSSKVTVAAWAEYENGNDSTDGYVIIVAHKDEETYPKKGWPKRVAGKTVVLLSGEGAVLPEDVTAGNVAAFYV